MVTRRVLLIDADPTFRHTLSSELGPYQVEVVAEPDPDRALQLAASNPPALIVLCIEETDSRVGFRVFEKCKKGPLASIPVVIATSSISQATFAKHRELKNHADDYVDKRTASNHELIATIDRLIGLGDDLAIPIEDEIPMEIVDDDVALEDAGDATEFDTSAAPPSRERAVEPTVEAETEAAFAALFGDDEAVSAPNEPAPASASATAAAQTQPLPEADISQAYDGDTIEYVEETTLPREEATATSPEGEAPAPLTLESATLAQPAEPEASPLASVIPPTQPPRTRTRPSGSRATLDLGLDKLANDAESERSGVHDRAALRKIGELESEVVRLRAELDRASSNTDSRGRETQFLNLREEMVAKETELRHVQDTLAERDRDLASADDRLRQIQHARSALEAKNTELEQRLLEERAKSTQLSAAARTSAAQLTVVQQELETMTKAHSAAEESRAQLEHELAKERSTIATATSDAEQLVRSERDQLLAQFKAELAAAKADGSSAQAAAVADMRDQLEAAHRTALSEVVEEARRVAATQQQDALAALKRAHASEIVDLQAEHARDQVALRTELGAEIARIEAALAAAHAAHRDTISGQEASANKLQSQHREMLAAHDRALGQIKADHDNDLAQVTAANADEVRQLKASHASEVAAYEAELSELKAAHQRAISALQDQLSAMTTAHHEALNRVKSELREELASARMVVQEAVASAEAAHRNELADQAAQHAVALEQAQRNHLADLERQQIDHAAALALHDDTLKEARQTHAADLDRLRSVQAADLEQLRRDHSIEFERLRGSHAAELAAREEAYEEMCDREVSAHEHEVAELRAEFQRSASALELKLDVAKRELAEQAATAERTIAALNEQHSTALIQHAESLQAKHKSEIAELRIELDQVSQAARRSADAHRTALAEAEAAHAIALSRASESARNEVNEFKDAANAARSELDELRTRTQTENEELKRLHAQTIADQQASAKAELVRALAAQKAELEKSQIEFSSEREQLQQALAAARDSQTRSASELAAAVQSIADRNAELRAHAGAIIERDQRIAELRKEIEAIENENASYQDQVLRAYQKIKTDEAMVARARKAMAIALTALDDEDKTTTT